MLINHSNGLIAHEGFCFFPSSSLSGSLSCCLLVLIHFKLTYISLYLVSWTQFTDSSSILAMQDSIYSDYPPPLSPAQKDFLVTTVKDWTAQHGLMVRPAPSFISNESNPHGVLATNAPVTLFPSPFPRSCFEEAKALQTVYNQLYAAITCDEKWIGKIMEE